MKKLLFLLFTICAALPQDAVCTSEGLSTSTTQDTAPDIETASGNNESENNNPDVKSKDFFKKSPFATTSNWGIAKENYQTTLINEVTRNNPQSQNNNSSDTDINTNSPSSYWDIVTKNYQTKQINDVKATYDETQNKSNASTTNNSTETNGTTNNTSTAKSEESAPMTPDPEKVQQAKDAEQAYQDAREVEKAGRALAAISTASSGAGGYALGVGISEKISDKNAEKAMNEYIGKMYCNYGGWQQVDLGDTEIIPDGGELFNYYQEYVNTANRLKSTKAALNLTPGIESQVVYTDAKYNLYNYQSSGARGTGEISLARALMDKNSADAAAWSEQKDKSTTKLEIGGTLAGTGVILGLEDRQYTNKYREQRQKDSKKENSKKK